MKNEQGDLRVEIERRIEREKINLSRAQRELEQARNDVAAARAEIKRLKAFLGGYLAGIDFLAK